MTALEILQAARKRIEKRSKWSGKEWESPTGRVCALGAVKQVAGLPVTGLTHLDDESRNAVKMLVDAIGKDQLGDVARYNDSHNHDCVLAMFDAAIEKNSEPANHEP